MCGIIGFYSKKTSPEDLETLRTVLIESRIRGKHASGIAWFDGKKIQCEKKPVPIDELVEGFDLNKVVVDGAVSLIAHARYSTSNLLFNQPIVDSQMAIVHNGVVTQADPSTWESTYGYKWETENDSELLLRAILAGDNPQDKFPAASISAITLDKQGDMVIYRNGKRPMWGGKTAGGCIIASTKDILLRAGIEPDKIFKVQSPDEDLQRRTIDTWTAK